MIAILCGRMSARYFQCKRGLTDHTVSDIVHDHWRRDLGSSSAEYIIRPIDLRGRVVVRSQALVYYRLLNSEGVSLIVTLGPDSVWVET